jgi:hypothetical protein
VADNSVTIFLEYQIMAEVNETAKLVASVTLSNAVELVGQIMTKVVGNDISDMIKDQPLTRKLAYDYATSVIGRELNVKIGNF